MARKSKRPRKDKIAAIPVPVMRTRKFANLSAWAVRVLLELTSQYNLHNNGDLMAAYSVLKDRGFRSKATLSRALRELLDSGMIVRTRQGGKNQCSLYALTWEEIDECIDRETRRSKLDVPSTRTPLGTWKDEPAPKAAA